MAGFGGSPYTTLLTGFSEGMIRAEEENQRRKQQALENALRQAANARAERADRRGEESHGWAQTNQEHTEAERLREARERETLDAMRAKAVKDPVFVKRLQEVHGYTRAQVDLLVAGRYDSLLTQGGFTPTEKGERAGQQLQAETPYKVDAARAMLPVDAERADAQARAYARHRAPDSDRPIRREAATLEARNRVRMMSEAEVIDEVRKERTLRRYGREPSEYGDIYMNELEKRFEAIRAAGAGGDQEELGPGAR